MSSPHGLIFSIMQYHNTALHLAADGGHLDMVRVLIEAGCDVNAAGEWVSLFMLAYDILIHMTYRYGRSMSVLCS